MLTTKKAAEKLNTVGLQYSNQDVAELARKGILTGSEKSGNIWLIPETALEQFIIQQTNTKLPERKKQFQEYMRDPIWQGVGAIAAIIALVPIIWGPIAYFSPYDLWLKFTSTREEVLLVQAKQWESIFEDDFKNTKGGWNVGNKTWPELIQNLSLDLGKEKYIWNLSANAQFLIKQKPARTVETRNIYLSIDCKRINGVGSPCGIIIRDSERGQHTFRIRDIAQEYFFYSIRESSDPKQRRADPMGRDKWVKSEIIKPNDTNKIAVVAIEDELIFYINDIYVDKFTLDKSVDAQIQSGDFGIFVAIDQGDKAIYEFDNFEARRKS